MVKTLEQKFDEFVPIIYKALKSLNANDQLLLGQIRQLEGNIKSAEQSVATLRSSAETVMNLFNANKDQINEVIPALTKLLKNPPQAPIDPPPS